MAVNDQWLTVALDKGLDTEKDNKTLQPGTPTRLENAVFDRPGSISKRDGTTRLGLRRAGQSYSSLSGALGLESRDNDQDLTMLTTTDEVVSLGDDGLWSYRGDWVQQQTEVTNLPRGPYEAWDHTTASTGSVRINAWEDTRGGVWAQMIRPDGGAYGQSFRVGSPGQTLGKKPRATEAGGKFQVFYLSGSALHCAAYSTTSPASPSGTINLIHPAVDPLNQMYDVVSVGNTVRVAVAVSASSYLAVIAANGLLQGSGSFPSWPNPVTYYGECAVGPFLCVAPDRSAVGLTRQRTVADNGWVAAHVIDVNTLEQIGDTIIMDASADVTGSGNVRTLTACFGTNPAAGVYAVHAFVEVSSSVPGDRRIRYSYGTTQRDESLVNREFKRHASLSSEAYLLNGGAYVWTSNVSTLQTTDFLVRDDDLTVDKKREAIAVLSVSGTLANVDVLGNTATRIATTRDFLNTNVSGSSFGGRFGQLTRTTMHPSSSWRPVDIDGVLHFAGGWIGTYDGSVITELGFALQVEGISGSFGSGSLGRNGIQVVGQTLGTSGPLATASFQYAVIPVASDTRGNKHRGSCTAPLYCTMSASVTQVQNTASITWPTISQTMRDGTRAADIAFEVYRTGPNGTVFQRVDDPARPLVNSTSSDYVTFNDTFSEGTRGVGEVMYYQPTAETGAPNIPVPSGKHLAYAGDQLWIGNLENASCDVAISNLRVTGDGMSFTDLGRMQIEPVGGPITAMGPLDDRIVIFKNRRIYAGGALGPVNADDQTPRPLPSLVTSDVGSVDGNPVIEGAGTVAKGLFFKSDRGIRLLDRGLQTADIGAEVKEFNSLTVVGGFQGPSSEQLRFYTEEGTTLVYDTRLDQWSTFTVQKAVAGCRWNDQAVFVGSDGRCWVETPGVYRDGSHTYPMTIELGWIPLGGKQGTSRIRDVSILGDGYSSHTFKCEFAYDYREGYTNTRTVPWDSFLLNPYGGDGELGYGSDDSGSYATLETITGLSSPLVTDGTSWTATLRWSQTGSVGNSGVLYVASRDGGSAEAEARDNERWVEGTGWVVASGTIGVLVKTIEGDVTIGTLEEAITSGSTLATILTADASPSKLIAGTEFSVSGSFAGGSFTTGSVLNTFGSADRVYQFRVSSPIQRTQSVRLRMSDVDREGTGQSFRITELKLRVARESERQNRLPARKLR